MNPFKPNREDATTKDLLIQLQNALHQADVGSPEYDKALDAYIKFTTAQASNKATHNRTMVWAPIAGNMMGVTVIGLFEAYGQIFTSKAMPLLFGRMFGR